MKYDIDKQQIANRLKEARISAGYATATAAAESMGEIYGTYAGNENGQRPASTERLAKYARRFRVSLEWLLAGTGRGPRDKNTDHDRLGEIYDLLDEIEDLPPGMQDQIIVFLKGMIAVGRSATDTSPTS